MMTPNEYGLVIIITAVIILGLRALMIQAEKNKEAQDEQDELNK